MGILNRKKNRQRRGRLGIGIADIDRKSPLRANEQESPEPERVTREDEQAGTAVHEMKEPPRAEG